MRETQLIMKPLTYKGYKYIVWYNDLGSHTVPLKHKTGFYCAYVELPKDHPFRKNFRKSTNSWSKVPYWDYDAVPLNVHGGLTFGELVKKGDTFEQGFTPGYWVGWDYGHVGDFINLAVADFTDKYWSYTDVENDCKDAIEQLIGAVEV